MPTLNRNIAPPSSDIEGIDLRELSTFTLHNGIPVYYIHTPNSAVLKVDLVFNGGIRNQNFAGQASATGSMLSEGTEVLSAKQLAEELDAFGAYLQSRTNIDDSLLSLYCLPRFLHSCMPLVVDILTNCTFLQKELDTYKRNAIQRYLVNSQRNGFLASRAFYSSIFGNQNAYGAPVNQIDYENISRETVLSFYNQNIRGRIKYIMLSGEVDLPILAVLQNHLGSLPNQTAEPKPIEKNSQTGHSLFIENPTSVQSTLKMGCEWVNRKHPDFTKLQVLNLALGGYFGSRLMRNIREEKGLTYGIHSSVESYLETGVFYIETEINNELRETGLREIRHELDVLRTNLIPEDELSLVKNYMLGSFLRGIDGPFSLMDRYKMIIDFGFTYDYFSKFVDTIKAVRASELRELANQYLNEELMTTVIAGKK
jgi:zinc protease